MTAGISTRYMNKCIFIIMYCVVHVNVHVYDQNYITSILCRKYEDSIQAMMVVNTEILCIQLVRKHCYNNYYTLEYLYAERPPSQKAIYKAEIDVEKPPPPCVQLPFILCCSNAIFTESLFLL